MNFLHTIRRVAMCAVTAVMTAVTLPAMPAVQAAGTTLTVGKSGAYQTIGEALGAAAALSPAGEGSRVTIAIEPGTYREQLLINTPYLTFINANPAGGEVVVTWYYGIGYKYYSSASSGYYKASDAEAKSAKGVAQRWGTAVRLQNGAKYFRAENITFENSFNRYVTDEELADGVEPTGETINVQRGKWLDATAKSSTERAAAMCVEADYCEFKNCNFYGSQDTLYTANPAYFCDCRIQGNTDYIFGSGDVVFDGCELRFAGYSDNAVGGYITAARQQTNGYLFWNCRVTANPDLKVTAGYFGRPWKETAHVLFYNAILQYDGIINSAGWTKMSSVEPWQATFREYGTKTMAGGSANTSGRVSGTVLSSCDATREAYLNGWMPVYFDGASGGKPAASISTAERYYIKNAVSGAYLGTADGNVITAAKADAAVWNIAEAGGGYYTLSTGGSRLDLANGDPADGTNIGLWEANTSEAQLFKFVSDSEDTYQIVTKATKDQSGLTAVGENVCQMPLVDGEAQLWTLEIYIEPMQGRLISDLIVRDRARAAAWSIADSTVLGDAIFGDRDFKWSELPEEVLGAERVITACDSKKASGTLAEMTAAQSVTLYIALDTRVPDVQQAEPAWLGGWDKTALRAASSNGEQFYLYRRDFAAGEQILLGNNGTSNTVVQYAVFVQPQAVEPIVTTATTTPKAAVTRGDVDCDGEVTLADAVMLAKMTAGLETGVTMQGRLNAECDGENSITSDDLVVLLTYLSGSISVFPI